MDKQKIAKELVLAAKEISAKGKVPPEFKEQWKNKDKDNDGKTNEPKPDFLKKKDKKAGEKLWEKVVEQYAEKRANLMVSDLLKQAGKYSDDDRLNPTGELWVNEFMPKMLDVAMSALKSARKRY